MLLSFILRRGGAWALSLLWSSINWVARRMTLHPQKLSARVISVGNLQAGGTGKTPWVAWMTQQALARGKKVLILTRGYQSQAERRGAILSPGSLADPDEVGDEAVLLHELCPEAWIGVGQDRLANYERVMEVSGKVDWVILEDGFQCWKIQKDLELLTWTSTPWGVNKVFREFAGAIHRADWVIWTKGETPPPDSITNWIQVAYELPPPSPQDQGKDFWLVAGVADPESVARSLCEVGYRIRKTLSFSDHAVYSEGQVQQLLSQAKKEGVGLLLTGKDGVKWKKLLRGSQEISSLQILEPRIIFRRGKESMEEALFSD